MKKLLAMLLVLAMVACLFVGCSSEKKEEDKDQNDSKPAATDEVKGSDDVENPANTDIKIGVVLVGDENEGYTYAHILGIRQALKNLGLDEKTSVVWKYSVGENATCKDAIVDCINQGCKVVFTNSYGHQPFAQEAAEEYPDIQIVAMTGDTAKKSGLENFHNAFTRIYEARYAAGVVAGMKIKELVEAGKLTDKNLSDGKVKVGYVGAYPYAEVVSGYTAFFLGIKSVYEDVVMDVQYTNSWFDIIAEKEAALMLIDRGCVIIGQHADSTGAPTACEESLAAGTTVYSVGYNIDMLAAAPNAALVSPTNEWDVYYTYAIGAVMKGEAFDTNWAEGFETNTVALTELGPNCAEGTKEAVDAVIEKIKNGELHVFDTSKFTVGGAECTHAFATDTDGDWVNDADEAIFDGYYHESYFQAAPAFNLRIDGITELNNG